MLRRTDCPSHEEMSVKYKGWLSQGAFISLRDPCICVLLVALLTVTVDHSLCGGWTFRGLSGPNLGFLLGGSAEGVQQIGSGSSTRSKKLVIVVAIALEHSSQISHARTSFGRIF